MLGESCRSCKSRERNESWGAGRERELDERRAHANTFNANEAHHSQWYCLYGLKCSSAAERASHRPPHGHELPSTVPAAAAPYTAGKGTRERLSGLGDSPGDGGDWSDWPTLPVPK
ncbi:hypothetical protein TYRP_006306 [Tyrophagus putrescentiae]|nr:hypothetical protein TYRP_006306 [Tyrophagus putrescentiae]